jgi:tRNA G18 (ribose-2'-O)-methylase SpoU
MSSTAIASAVRFAATTGDTAELIQEIDRPDDPRLEPYRRVGDPAWLAARGLFVAEGRLVVARLFELGHPAESVMVTPAAWSALAPLPGARCPIYVAPPAILNAVTGFNFHRGCLAIAPRLPARSLAEVATAERLIVLEGVGNPDNVGGIFRAGGALGAGGVLLGPGCADPLYRKAVRTSMGAVLRVPFSTIDAWPGELAALKEWAGVTIVALSPSGSTPLDQLASSLPRGVRYALLAGAEGAGLSAPALAVADATVRIPIHPRSDSLNVVVAVAIALARLSPQPQDV